MALLLTEERFLKIKQAVEEEQNQPGVMQELLLKLMDDLQILKGSQQEKEKTTAQSFTPYCNFSMIDDEEARDNFLKDVCTFLRKFSRIPFGVTPKVILIAWESFGKIKDALMDKQYQQEDIQELMSKLLKDVQNIREELSEYINCPSWNRPTFYDNDDDEYTIIYSKPKAITPDLSIEEPDNSLSMGDEHLDTIPSVENLVPIPSELEGISDYMCNVPVCEDPSTFNVLNDHSEILSDSNDDGTSSDDDDFEDIEYVSLKEKLVNISRLITNIESLKDNPTPDHVFKSSSSFPIPVTDSDSFFEKSDTSFSYSDNSLPEFETFSDHTEETRSGSTTTHANNSLPEYDSFLFEVEPDQGGLISIVMEEISDNSTNDPLLELLEFESFHFDPSFPRPSPEPPDVEICLIIETDAPVINNFDELNEDEYFDLWGRFKTLVNPSASYLANHNTYYAVCGVNLLLGTCLNCTYGDGKPVTCCGCEGPLRGGFCSFCASSYGNSFNYNPNPNSFNESQNFSDYPPQPQYEMNIDFDEEEGENNNDILQIEDEILREKLLNVNLLVDKIEALKLTPFIPFVLENPSSSPIPVVDSDFLVEEVDTFLVSEDSIPRDCPDFKDSRVHGFVHSYIRASYPQLHLGNSIS
ncbi:hypothetical protein Tco_0647018 [Tanacetum coccineum]